MARLSSELSPGGEDDGCWERLDHDLGVDASIDRAGEPAAAAFRTSICIVLCYKLGERMGEAAGYMRP